MTRETFQLGREPSVDNWRPSQPSLKQNQNSFFPLNFNSLKFKENKPSSPDPPPVPPKKRCPDPTLYEDFVEPRMSRVKSPDIVRR